MMTSGSHHARRGGVLRIGFLALTDAAPFVVAQELGLFARHRLEVQLQREIGWATIREKIIYGELEAAHAPAPLLWSMQLGLGCLPCPVLTGLVLNLHGNAITLSRALWEAGVRDAATLAAHVRTRRARAPLAFGVVFPYSSHHLLLRSWLRSAGIEPERDVRIVVVPPAQMFRNLNARTIDGFCAGEPWNSLAVREGIGWCPAWSAALALGHVEKILLVTRVFAAQRRAEHAALIAALTEAAAWCDEPQNREPLAALLSGSGYLNLPAHVMLPALQGRFDGGQGRIEEIPSFLVFHRDDAGVPTSARAATIQREMIAGGLLPPTVPADLPAALFREDIFHEAARHTAPIPHSA